MSDYPWPTYGPIDCRHCGETFERKCVGQVYCSAGCRWNWWYHEKKRQSPTFGVGIRECIACGEWFEPVPEVLKTMQTYAAEQIRLVA